MPLVDPPYPSFTLMVTRMYTSPPCPFDSSHLPGCSAAHTGHFHPYQGSSRRSVEPNDTPAVNYTSPLDTIVEEPEVVVIHRLTVYYDEDEHSTDMALSLKLSEPVVEEFAVNSTVRARSAAMLGGVWKSVLRRTSHTLLAMRVFHAGNKK